MWDKTDLLVPATTGNGRTDRLPRRERPVLDGHGTHRPPTTDMQIGALGDIHGAFDVVSDIIARHPDVTLWVQGRRCRQQ